MTDSRWGLAGGIAWSRRRNWAAPGVLAVVVALVAVPFLQGRYPFLLDFAVGPTWDPLPATFYGFRPPIYGGRLPLFAALAPLPPDLGATVLLPGCLALAAVCGYVFLPGPQWARCYGAVLLVVNPFVYDRVLVGQWAIVWGLAALPVVIATVAAYLERPAPRRLLAAVGAITLLAVSSHVLYAALIPVAAIVAFRYAAVRERAVFRRALTVGSAALAVNAFWVLPALLDDRGFGAGGAADLVAFAPRADAPPLLATAAMRGFWRGGHVHGADLLTPLVLLVPVVVCLAIYGAIDAWDGERGYVVKAMAVTAVVAVPLGTGVQGPTGPVFAWLAEHVPLFAGMRDANKFVALLVLAYAYLGSLGVAALGRTLRADAPADADAGASRTLDRDSWLATLRSFVARPSRRGPVAAVAVGLVVLVPIVYSFPMVTGYAGQVSVGEYPEEWAEADAVVSGGQGSVLVLPWHGYVDLPWLEGPLRRARMPARHYFSGPVVQGDTVELGPIYSRSDNPVSGQVEAALGLGPDSEPDPAADLPARLAHANVEWVVLARTADWRAYTPALRDRDGLRPVLSNDQLAVFRVEPTVPPGYAVDEAGAVGPTAPGDREPLAVSERSPVTATVAGTDRASAAVTRTQQAAVPGWRAESEGPVDWRGGRAVFPASADGQSLHYAPFTRVYVPSYAIAVLAVGLLLANWLVARRNGAPPDRRSTPRWRVRP